MMVEPSALLSDIGVCLYQFWKKDFSVHKLVYKIIIYLSKKSLSNLHNVSVFSSVTPILYSIISSDNFTPSIKIIFGALVLMGFWYYVFYILK